MALVADLKKCDLYKIIPERKHIAFPEMKHDFLEDNSIDDLRKWISNSLNKFSKKHFYKI